MNRQTIRALLKSHYSVYDLKSLSTAQKAEFAVLLMSKSSKNWMDEYKQLEEDNDHCGALILLASRYGTKDDIEVARAIQTLTRVRQYKSQDNTQIEMQLRKRLWPKAIKEFAY